MHEDTFAQRFIFALDSIKKVKNIRKITRNKKKKKKVFDRG